VLRCKFFKTENAENYYSHLESLLPLEIVTSDSAYPEYLIIIDNFFFSNYSEKIIDRIKKKLPTRVLIDFGRETGVSEDDFTETLTRFKQMGLEENQITFSFNTSAKKLWLENHNQIIFSDYFAISASSLHTQHNQPASIVNVKDRPLRVNFLTAKLHKKSRAHMLNALFESNLRHSTLLGILGNSKHLDDEFKTNSEFVKFVDSNRGSLDNVPTQVARDESGHPDVLTSQGWSNNCDIYDKSAVSIICETHETNDSTFVTEKTYRSILNRHPFVIRAAFPILKHLQALGFKTFSDFIDESYDESSEISLEYSNLLVERAEQLLSAVKQHPEKIQAVVDHNYNMLLRHGQAELDRLVSRATG
jgi:hypothetical protein